MKYTILLGSPAKVPKCNGSTASVMRAVAFSCSPLNFVKNSPVTGSNEIKLALSLTSIALDCP